MIRILILTLFLVGCATHPLPKFCGEKETINCQPMTPGMKEGSSRGHTVEPKADKMMFYVPPEELWPEEFPAKPKVCASPFQGNQILR